MFEFKNYFVICGVCGLAIVAFIAGWRVSYNHYAVKQLQVDYKIAQQNIQQRDKIIAITNANISAQVQQANILQIQLSDINGHYQASLLELQNVKNRLNATNHVNIGLVRAMGATKIDAMRMPKNVTSASEYAHYDESVPASTVAEWILGLKQDNDNCHMIHNATIKLYDNEMNIINAQ